MALHGPATYYFSVPTMMCNHVCPQLMHAIFGREDWVSSIETECPDGQGSGWLRVHVNDDSYTAQHVIEHLKAKSKGVHLAEVAEDPANKRKMRYK